MKIRRFLLLSLLSPLTLLLVYVLSFGPVDKFVGRDGKVVRTFYAPLLWLDDNFEWFHKAYGLYMQFWDKHWS